MNTIGVQAVIFSAAMVVSVACRPAQSAEEQRIECRNPVNYDGQRIDGKVALGSIFSGGAASADVALREPGPAVEKYYAAVSSLCDQYNAGVLNRGEYVRRADALTHSLFGELNPTGSQEQKFQDVYEQLVPTPPALTFDFTMYESVAGQAERVVRPNEPVPTGARVRFTIRASTNAYVYMLQNTERDHVSALYPHAQMQLVNPLPASAVHSIPPVPNQWFEVDRQDLGTENVYIVASSEPVPQLQADLSRLGGATADESIQAFAALAPLTTLRPGFTGKDCATRGLELKSDAAPCTRTRGLVLVGGKDNLDPQARPAVSLRVRSSPGDKMIVKVFPWQHVRAEDYPKAMADYAAPSPSGNGSRGIMVEDP